MAILGLLLLLAAGGLAVEAIVENTSSISVDALGQTFSLSPGWLFVAGIATGAIAMLGLSMIVAGMARARRRRGTLNDTKSSVQDLQSERDRLAVQLERERSARTDGQVANGRTSDEIDLADERRTELADDRREPVGSGRRTLFNRKH